MEIDVVTITGPKVVELRRCRAAPCGDGEALVAIKAVGVCATDVELFDGTMGYYHSGLSRFPLVPGHEWAGEVLELGPRVPEHLRVGQRVVGEHCTGCEPIEEEISARCRICCRPGGLLRCPRRKETGFFGREGAFQTVLRFPARQLHVLPPETPWDLAVLAEPLATACKAVRLADLAKVDNSRVVVVGDGAVGLLLLQLLLTSSAQRLRVALLGAQAARLQRAQALGAELAWDVAVPGVQTALTEEGELPSLVFEAAGTPSAVKLAVSVCAPGGTVVLLGLSGNLPVELCTDKVVLRQLTLRGSLSSEPEDWLRVREILSLGCLTSVVTHVFEGLQAYETAIEHVRRPEASYPHRAPLDSMFRFALLAALFALSRADSQEFLGAAAKIDVSEGQAKPEVQVTSEVTDASAAAARVSVSEAKEIDLNAVENPYLATGATAECLALIFMIVACVICYLECCK
ncbi:unnamed protein product [Durusdinium trenchii]|uniref:Sorbitol dehydrogenase n=1 Tax=Durusdinium trenchii TaxID=1381693 RepID=A0ABP0NWR0_9DINO